MSQFSLFHLFKSIVSLADDLRKPLIHSLCLIKTVYLPIILHKHHRIRG